MSDVLANLTNITAPRVPLVDERTNLISREWYRFFLSLFQLTGSGTSTINLTDLQVGPPNPEYGPISTGGTNSVAVPTAGAVAYGDGISYAFTGVGTAAQVLTSAGSGTPTWATAAGGSVTSVSVVSANGFAGTVATPSSTPAITLTTTITGLLKGNATAISTAVANIDYVGISAPVIKTADFAVASGESFLINNKTGSTCTVTLPTASSWSGRSLTFTNYQNQTVMSASSNVVSRAGGAAALAILEASAGAWATLVSDGTNWLEVAGGIAPSTATFIITE